MFARMLEFTPRMDKKDEFVKVLKNEILPVLKKQSGFLETLPLFPGDEERKDGCHQPVDCEAGCREI